MLELRGLKEDSWYEGFQAEREQYGPRYDAKRKHSLVGKVKEGQCSVV